MNTLPRLKFFSWILLLALLTVTVNGVHARVHGAQEHLSGEGGADCHAGTSTHHCPCTPPEQHQEGDGCDPCVNCACHAPLALHQPTLKYNPGILSLDVSEPFQHLPEVFLSKFIPPQNLA